PRALTSLPESGDQARSLGRGGTAQSRATRGSLCRGRSRGTRHHGRRVDRTKLGLRQVVAQQAMPTSDDAREAPELAPDADIPFVPWPHLAVLNAFYRRRRPLEATLAGRPVTIATTWPARAGDDVTDQHVIDLKIDAAEGEICVPRRVLDELVATLDSTLSFDRLGAR